MTNKQPFYHRMTILFTGTEDVSEAANSLEFADKLARFLKDNLGSIVKNSVQFDGPVDAEPGDPADLP